MSTRWTNGSGQVFDEGTFSIGMSAHPKPANDAFGNAEVLNPALPQTVDGSSEWATTEAEEPGHAGAAPRQSVWYRLTPGSEDPVRIMSYFFSSGFEPRIAVYEGEEVDELTAIADNGGTGGLPVGFLPDPGTEYVIAIDAVEYGTDFTLTVDTPTSPANDDFADALMLPPGFNVAVDGTTIDATSEPGEPDHFTDLEAFYSVWFRWVAPSTGTATSSDLPERFPLRSRARGLQLAHDRRASALRLRPDQ